jgi:hypothetical protein
MDECDLQLNNEQRKDVATKGVRDICYVTPGEGGEIFNRIIL